MFGMWDICSFVISQIAACDYVFNGNGNVGTLAEVYGDSGSGLDACLCKAYKSAPTVYGERDWVTHDWALLIIAVTGMLFKMPISVRSRFYRPNE